MPNFAHAEIIGHLGKDAELKAFGEHNVLSFSVAVSTGYSDKKTTTWWNCSLWGKSAPKLVDYLKKGTPVLVHGEPALRQYQKSDGQTGTVLEIRAADVRLLGRKEDNNAAPAGDDPDAPF